MQEIDLAVIGGGPAGLSAAIYGASEGLKTVLFERSAGFGGQSASSSRIENYLGFSNGLSGKALATQAHSQAIRLGAECRPKSNVQGIAPQRDGRVLVTVNGEEWMAKAVIIACGLSYRRLNLPGEELRGIHYGTGATGAMKGKAVVIVGGANSAGQAAIHAAEKGAKRVDMIVRGPGLEQSMSDYLVKRIQANKVIHVHTQEQVTKLQGRDEVESIVLAHDGELDCDDVFVFIGSAPDTDAFRNISRDQDGYFITDDLFASQHGFSLETSMPGVFAVGDIRSGSVHRVATAVGSGAEAVEQVHQYLALRAAQKEGVFAA